MYLFKLTPDNSYVDPQYLRYRERTLHGPRRKNLTHMRVLWAVSRNIRTFHYFNK